VTASLAPTRFPDSSRPLKSATAITLFLLAALGPVSRGNDESIARANDAFQTGLWDVAAGKYRSILEDENTRPDLQAGIAMRLAECLVRDGRPFDALELLNPGAIAADQPTAAFWRGQALAGSGRFADAVAEFNQHLSNTEATHRLEAALTCANLQLSLDDGSGALRTLAAFADSADAPEAARANLQRAGILLDAGYPEDARSFLPDEVLLSPDAVPLGRFIQARLLLTEGDAENASGIFAALLQDPVGQTTTTHHGAALGLADALFLTTGPDAASRSLLAFLSENQTTPLLEPAFSRLWEWLPEAPANTDATLTKTAEWIPVPPMQATGLVATRDGAAAAWPSGTTLPDLAAFSMFTRALGIHRIQTPAARHEARVLMAQLRAYFPGHFLTRRSFLAESRWLLEEGDTDAALHRLTLAADGSRSGATRAEAMFLEATLLANSGAMTEAADLFDQAAALLDADIAEVSRLNAALARLEGDSAPGETPELSARLRTILELERALAIDEPAASLAALGAFLRDHPEHPRAPEARLAAAERALRTYPPDVSFARAQLDSLGPIDDIEDANVRIALARLRIAQSRYGDANPDVAIEIARGILNEAPSTSAAIEAALALGRNLFDTGNFNDARIAFERLALEQAEQDDGDPALTQAAFLLAARAAALGATAQSREEALALFDQAIAVKNAPMDGVAMLEKARLMIDLNRLSPAIALLREYRKSMTPQDPLYLPAGLLLGEAIYANAAGDPRILEQALHTYNELLDNADPDSGSLFHRLQYLRGITLEKLPHPDAPELKREAEAIEAYFSVIQRAGDQPPAEWEWFERCGFAALSLLEKNQRWQAAIHLARRIASFNGPRAADAAEHADQLQLKHMIWED